VSVDIDHDIALTFSEAVTRGTGNIILKTLAGVTVATYDAATSANLSITGNTLIINPTADLNYSTAYSVEFDAGSIKDLAGNNYEGSSSYNFITVFSGRTKYFVLPSSLGANFTDFDLSYGSVTLPREQVTFVGSSAVDAVFVRPGVTMDFTLSGSGADKIYLGSNFASYTASIAGSVMTLQRGSGATRESVSFIKSTSAISSDSVIFADGTLNSLDLYNNLKTAAALPALSTTETSIAPLAPALAGSVLNASIKAFALYASGDTFAPAKPGVAMTVVGSVGVDTVYVPRGGVVDCTLLGSGQDVIYLTGNWGDYTKVISGSVVTFSRTVDEYNESVKVVGSATNLSLNDHLVFADGAVYSGDAKAALATSLSAAISAVSGYDATMVTPGLTPVITSAATASFAENGSSTVYTAMGTDADAGTTLSYALSGTDGALFNINASTGAVTFKVAPNFEAPTDAGANNVYDITVTANDGVNTSAARAVAITVTDLGEAGQSVIGLGSFGKLIAPVQVEGNWYYYWDRNGDGIKNTDLGSNGLSDLFTHDELDGIFTSTLSEVNAGTTGAGTDTTDLIRYANLNGVKVALPTANGGTAYPQGIDAFQNGTSYTLEPDGDMVTGGTTIFNELLAIWDAYNGGNTQSWTGPNVIYVNGAPPGWGSEISVWSASPSPKGHVVVSLTYGQPSDNRDYEILNYVALQVLPV
jgi:hypothetical protein